MADTIPPPYTDPAQNEKAASILASSTPPGDDYQASAPPPPAVVDAESQGAGLSVQKLEAKQTNVDSETINRLLHKITMLEEDMKAMYNCYCNDYCGGCASFEIRTVTDAFVPTGDMFTVDIPKHKTMMPGKMFELMVRGDIAKHMLSDYPQVGTISQLRPDTVYHIVRYPTSDAHATIMTADMSTPDSRKSIFSNSNGAIYYDANSRCWIPIDPRTVLANFCDASA